MDSFAIGTDGGFFCPQCPVVVLDREKFAELANFDGGCRQWAVAGIINLDAVKDEDALLYTEENAIPLVEFLRARSPIKQVHRESNKIGRNEPCPCGSGKKYKKCCGTVKLLFP
jgi:preprotein translocase subunit SecA